MQVFQTFDLLATTIITRLKLKNEQNFYLTIMINFKKEINRLLEVHFYELLRFVAPEIRKVDESKFLPFPRD